MQAAMAIMAALLRRERTGVGEHLDVSIADGAFAMMSLYVDEYLATGVEPGPGHYILTGRYACYDVYECSDGRFVSVGAIEPQFWRNLCRAARARPVRRRPARRRRARPRSAPPWPRAFATRTRDEWVGLLGPADTCVAPVNTVAEAVADEQYVARGNIADAVTPPTGPSASRRRSGPAPSPPDGPVRDPRRRGHRHRGAARRRRLDRAHVDDLDGPGVVA